MKRSFNWNRTKLKRLLLSELWLFLSLCRCLCRCLSFNAGIKNSTTVRSCSSTVWGIGNGAKQTNKRCVWDEKWNTGPDYYGRIRIKAKTPIIVYLSFYSIFFLSLSLSTALTSPVSLLSNFAFATRTHIGMHQHNWHRNEMNSAKEEERDRDGEQEDGNIHSTIWP